MLGNSKGQNKGKIYVRDASSIDHVDAEAALYFQEWFSENYNTIENELRKNKIHDQDILNDTYLKVYDNIMYRSPEIKCLKSYFSRSYYTNYVAKQIGNSKNRFEEITDDKTSTLNDQVNEAMSLDVLDEILNDREAELMKMVLFHDRITLKAISKILGIKYHTVCYIIKRAKEKLKNNRKILIFN